MIIQGYLGTHVWNEVGVLKIHPPKELPILRVDPPPTDSNELHPQENVTRIRIHDDDFRQELSAVLGFVSQDELEWDGGETDGVRMLKEGI